MNLLLLEDADFLDACHVRLQGRRLQHLREVHRAEVGSTLRVGRIGGLMGQGQLLQLDAQQAELRVALDQELADFSAPLAGVREVAFFPPMTGG